MSVRTKRIAVWAVLAFWVIVAAASGSFSTKVSSVEKNNAIDYLPANSPSTEVALLASRFPEGQETSLDVVYHRASGLTSADLAVISADIEKLGAPANLVPTEQVGWLTPSEISGNRTTAYLPIGISSEIDITQQQRVVQIVRSIVGEGGHGLDVKVGGPEGFLVDGYNALKGIDSTLLVAAGVVVALLLLVIYRSPFMWLVPLGAVGVADVVSQAFIYFLARHGVTVTGEGAGVLNVLVFGVGTDYGLLVIARYREELRHHDRSFPAMVAAYRGAAPAIVASASTVAVSVMCLLVSSLNSDRSLGPVCAAGVLIAMLAMLTMLPALLVVVGRRAFWPFVPRFDPDAERHTGPAGVGRTAGLWATVGAFVARRSRRVWVGSAIVLGVMCLGILSMNTNLTNTEGFRSSVDSVAAQDILDTSFPAGTFAPLVIAIPNYTTAEVAAASKVTLATPGIVSVTPSITSGTVAGFLATAAYADSTPGADLTVTRLRAALTRLEPGILVGGSSAVDLDVRVATLHDERMIIPLVLAVVLIILVLLLRSLSGAAILVATVVLSFGAALGMAAWANQAVFGFAASDPGLPLFAFIFLVALGCDYNIFLMARVREESLRHGTRAGVERGLTTTGGVITSAGVVLASTFAMLGVVSLVTLTEVGWCVAFGVLLDTFVVRSALVPALAIEVGPAWWWPSALWRAERSGRLPGGGEPEAGAAGPAPGSGPERPPG